MSDEPGSPDHAAAQALADALVAVDDQVMKEALLRLDAIEPGALVRLRASLNRRHLMKALGGSSRLN